MHRQNTSWAAAGGGRLYLCSGAGRQRRQEEGRHSGSACQTLHGAALRCNMEER